MEWRCVLLGGMTKWVQKCKNRIKLKYFCQNKYFISLFCHLMDFVRILLTIFFMNSNRIGFFPILSINQTNKFTKFCLRRRSSLWPYLENKHDFDTYNKFDMNIKLVGKLYIEFFICLRIIGSGISYRVHYIQKVMKSFDN